ncbi:MAG: M50 family metallopeptidase [Alphaproteobacteria bacterium]
MQNFMNTLLKYIKWPLALLCAFCFYPLSEALVQMIGQTFTTSLFIYFLLPIGGVMLLWGLVPGLSGNALTIFAHELTHMLAALLTGHKPKSMSIRPDEGGSFTYLGKGNWLITIAPYFFPTFPFLWMLGGLWFDFQGQAFPTWYVMTFGFLVGYYIVSNFYQIHSEQTDFKKAGFLFSVMFIPGANLLLIGYLWSFALKGWKGLSAWQNFAWDKCIQFIQEIIKSLQNFF